MTSERLGEGVILSLSILCILHNRLGSGQGHRQRRQQSGQMDQGGDTYQEGARQVDEQRRGVLPTLPQLRHPVRPETER